jgi:uncharacterized protein YdcH (DUF465 family)
MSEPFGDWWQRVQEFADENERLREQNGRFAAEIERLKCCEKHMLWLGEKKNNLTAEIERLRGVIDAMADEALKVYKPELDAKDAEIERLREDLNNAQARGIHTCHDQCQRVECVQRREIERLRAGLRVTNLALRLAAEEMYLERYGDMTKSALSLTEEEKHDAWDLGHAWVEEAEKMEPQQENTDGR